MKRFPTPKKFTPKHPDKYVGDVDKIVCRSNLEYRYFKYFDENSSIIKYSSEEIVVPYLSPMDRKMHRYFPDFLIQIKTKSGQIKNVLIEIKPSVETVEPKKGKKKISTFMSEVATWQINSAKWAAAEIFAKKHNMDFIVLTEKHVKIKW